MKTDLFQEQTLPELIEPLVGFIAWLRDNSDEPTSKDYCSKLKAVVNQLVDITPEVGLETIVEALQSMGAGRTMTPLLSELRFNLFKRSYEADYPQYMLIKAKERYTAVLREGVSP